MKLGLFISLMICLSILIIPVLAETPGTFVPNGYYECAGAGSPGSCSLTAGESFVYNKDTVSFTGAANTLSLYSGYCQGTTFTTESLVWQISTGSNITTLTENGGTTGGGTRIYGYWEHYSPANFCSHVYLIRNATERPRTTNVTFSMSETGNFTKKLSGVLVTLSNGQTNTTGTDGTCLISVYPNSSAYTYSAGKTGYYTLFDSLGGIGETGGIEYGTLGLDMGAIPTGFTRTTVYVTDGSTGGTLVGATLNLRDVQNNSWKNTTSIAAGIPFDVFTGHTIDIYGSYPGVYLSSYELNAVAGGNYYLPLMPPTPTPTGGLDGGLLNLFVNVRDGNGNASLAHATVTVKLPTGATTVRDSGDWGSATFVVPNNTVIILSGSKTGYNTISQSFTSEKDLEQMVDLRMYKIWALPTTAVPGPVVTDPITGLPVIDPLTGLPVTAAPVDSRTDAQKDADLMGLLRDNGETIMNLAILAIIFGLLKMLIKF